MFFQVGRIVVSGPLDRESVSEYLIVVVARDSAEDSQEVQILIPEYYIAVPHYVWPPVTDYMDLILMIFDVH